MAVEASPPAVVQRLNQGTLTDRALAHSRRLTREMEQLLVSMFEGGQTLAGWQRFLDISDEIDALWAELDLSCWAMGQLAPWVPQAKGGEPTLAQLEARVTVLPFVPDGEPDNPALWTWSTLDKALEFLQTQKVMTSAEWNASVRVASDQRREVPITVKIGSQIDEFRRHLTEGFAAGDSVADFKKRIAGSIESTDSAIERNFRTSSKRAYLDGVEKVTNVKTFPYVKYVATTDNRTRPAHRAMDGKIIRVGTQEYAYAMSLQREPQCRCTMIPMTEKQAVRAGLRVDSADLMSVGSE